MTKDASAVTPRIRDLLVGQEALWQTIDHALAEDHLAHAYLLLGARGCGRLRSALAVAQALLCTAQAPPCGACPGCWKVSRFLHPDLHIVVPSTREEDKDPERKERLLAQYASDRYHLLDLSEAASIGIDRVRELKEEVSKALVEGERRVIVLVAAERMTEQAAQAALKLLEEPPPRTVLLLTAEDSSQLLPTLVSRCQRLRLRLLTREEVARMLERDLGATPAESRLLSALSGGSLGRALEMREESILRLRDLLLRAFDCGAPESGGLSPQEVERRVQALERGGVFDAARRAGELLLIWLRDVLAARCGQPPESLSNADRSADAIRLAAVLPVTEIGRRVRLVEELAQSLEQNVNPSLAFHVALARIGAGPGEEGFSL